MKQRLIKATICFICAIFCCAAHLQGKENIERPVDSVKVILFVAADLKIPEGAQHRITKIADSADTFLLNGMKRLGYPPEVKTLFKRNAEGHVELLHVRGDEPAASGKYSQPNCVGYVINKAIKEYNIPKAKYVWWVFVYLGDRPTRYEPWAGNGDSRGGGWAIVNYDTVPGEIRPDQELTEGFNFEYKLKSTIHELVHGFGLMHMGPDPTLDMGNSLMGPNPTEYASRQGPKGDHVYLAASEAAMLWKHPIMTGKAMPPIKPWDIKLSDYKAAFNPTADTVTISGKLISQQPAHSVVLIDDRGEQSDYWSRSYTARLTPDGSFQISIKGPAKTEGQYRLLFCFENGIVSGKTKDKGSKNRDEMHKNYRFQDGQFHFQE